MGTASREAIEQNLTEWWADNAADVNGEMEPTPSPFVQDPLNPTDAELRAAIDRGIERGDILLWDDIKDEFAARYGLNPDDLIDQDALGDEDAEVLE